MKIGLLNFYFANNYGATLQCYALYSTLKKCGHEVEIIDYRPKEILNAYHMKLNIFKDKVQELKGEKFSVTYIIKLLHRILQYYFWYIANWKLVIKMKKFDDFIDKNLPDVSARYNSYEEIISNPPKCDCYIAGSDQIWNMDNTGGKLDKTFFLKFGKKNVTRVVYGASCGKEDLLEEDVNCIINYCENIDAVSVREQSLMSQLYKNKTNLSLSKVCDPVFLIDKEEWDKVKIFKGKEDEYILLYLLDKNKYLQDIINEIKIAYPHYKIYDISYKKNNINGIDKWKQSCGPDCFLSYISNAKMIITDSFHGTAFSIIYHKVFVSLVRRDTGIRITDLLVNIKLANQIYDPKRNIKNYSESIDFSYAEKYIKKEKEKSLTFLYNSIR